MLTIQVMTQPLRGGATERKLIGEATADCTPESVAGACEDYITLLKRAVHGNRDRFQRASEERDALPLTIVAVLTLTERPEFHAEWIPIADLRTNARVADHPTPELNLALATLPPDWLPVVPPDRRHTESTYIGGA